MAGRRRNQARGTSRLAPGPRRVLNADERQKLTVDAWGLVTFLQEAGLVRPDELEEALLLVAAFDSGEVDAADMALVLSSVIEDRERVAMILGQAQGRDGDDEATEDEDEDARPEPRLLH
ncbi:MAG: hypothetical protein PWR07_1159 [Bacillota bacterium]|nr:DUF494 family protein [Bacillota bacterium]MDK2931028.1 hypothetical protein [Bacillota bacterium]